MSLSNTATPYYYEKFRDQVLAGEKPVCQEISDQMNLIDGLIANPEYWYDDEAVNGWIDFCNNEMTLTDGSDLELLDSFKLWGEDLFGWYYFTDKKVYIPRNGTIPGHYELQRIRKRLRNVQHLIVTRGTAKTMYAALIQAYVLIVDTSTTNQIVTAPTLRQAEGTLSPIRTAISRARGPLFKFLTEGSLQNTTGDPAKRVKIASTKKGIQNFMTNSLLEPRAMSIDKLQGAIVKVATIDEWLSGDIHEDVLGAIEQGASKVDDYIILTTSSEGTIRNGIGDSLKIELESILHGDYYNPHVSVWYYKLDDITEVGDPDMWVKAAPNLGITVSYEAYQRDVERAEKNPMARNDILAKRFNLPMEGYTHFFAYSETIPCPSYNVDGMPCTLGADLSQGDDFCAFTCVFPVNNGFATKTRCYITQRTYDALPTALHDKYATFINEDSLVVMESPVLKIPDVYNDVDNWLTEHQYTVIAFGYDPYNAREFVESYIADNGEYGIEKVIQGSKTESVPIGELKAYAESGELRFDQALMGFCMGNAVVLKDTNNNKKLLKERRQDKIDSVAAMLDAYILYKRYEDEFF